MSELLPLQTNSTLSSRVLRWIQVAEPKCTPLPMVILQECLKVYIKKQVLLLCLVKEVNQSAVSIQVLIQMSFCLLRWILLEVTCCQSYSGTGD